MIPSLASIKNWAIATFIVFILAAGVWTAVRNTNRISDIQRSATANRVANVLTWCHAINADRAVIGGLPPLPCLSIAYRTVQSNK